MTRVSIIYSNGSAKIEMPDKENVEMTFPSGASTHFHFKDFVRNCSFAIAHTSDEWSFLYDKNSYWQSPLNVRGTDELMAVVSLFHFCHEIFGNNKTKTTDFLSNVFVDSLPAGNYLIVPGVELQNELKEFPIFVNKGRVYKCEIEMDGSAKIEFYFRPYNTPMLSMSQINEKERDLNDKLKSEYRRILGNV